MKFDLSKDFDKERFKVRSNQLYKNNAKVELKEYRHKRSTQQNRMYWAWLNCLSQETGYTSDEMHEVVKGMFLGVKMVRVGNQSFPVNNSSKELEMHQFSDYCDKVRHWASEELGVYLPTPEEKVFEEFYFKYKE